eukprot:s2010_g2.t1
MARAMGVREEGLEEPPRPGDPGYLEALEEELRRKPKPSIMQDYNLEEAFFWSHRHVPPGSVLIIQSGPLAGDGSDAELALLVLSRESTEDGIWLGVSVLGSSNEEHKKSMQTYFKGGRRMVHLCAVDHGGSCPVGEDDALHVREFRWFPPGDFRADWLNAYALKKVKDGPKLAAEEEKAIEEERQKRREEQRSPGVSDTERRLNALRGGAARVSFAEPPGAPFSSRDRAGGPAGPRVGALRRPELYSRAAPEAAPLLDRVKAETIDLTGRRSESDSREKTKRRKRKERTLAQAAAAHQEETAKKERKRERDRSRSRRRRRRKRRRRRSNSSDYSSSRSTDSSDSSSLLPPLRRKSLRQPGSVFRLLEQQAFDFLAQDGVVTAQDDPLDQRQRPKLFTYYQLGLKPGLDPRSRDSKELALLCRSLDLLKEGKLESLSDLLAARLMAVETATKQGWGMARHLEIFDAEDEGPAPAHILLAAQKHGKQVERAGGKGSWPRATSWTSPWQADGQPQGKGKDQKGKGKKGKGKGKWKGGQVWANQDKDKKEAKPGEAAT